MNCFFFELGGVLHQGSPTRDSHRDSPQTMHDSKNRMSPGLNDNQSGPTKNLYSYSDTEEVIKSKSLLKTSFIDE